MGKYTNAMKIIFAELDALDKVSIELTGKPCAYRPSEEIQKLRDLIEANEDKEND